MMMFLIFLSFMLSKETDKMMMMMMMRNELLEMLMDGWADRTYNETVNQNKNENCILRPGNKTFQMRNERTEMTKETNLMETMWKTLDKRNL